MDEIMPPCADIQSVIRLVKIGQQLESLAPLFQTTVFDVLDERVPVERLVELILKEVDGLVHLVHAELLAGRVVVHERGRERMHGLFAVARERAVHGDVVHHVRVAGVVGREPAVEIGRASCRERVSSPV